MGVRLLTEMLGNIAKGARYRFGEAVVDEAIPVKRDTLPSIAYSEELIFSLSVTLQSTDRRHGIVGQERCHFQCDS